MTGEKPAEPDSLPWGQGIPERRDALSGGRGGGGSAVSLVCGMDHCKLVLGSSL
jgi:hypothetical protein